MHRIQARYTEVLLNLLENERTKALIDEAMSDYPIYVSTSEHTYIPNIIPSREEINEAILNYYKYREIGFETVGRFLDELKTSLHEIMPYYNQLMFTQDQDYNVVYNVDYIRTIERNRDEATDNTTSTQTNATDSTSTSTSTSAYGKNVSSDTPQDSLSIPNTGIDSVTYANNVNWNKNNGYDEGNSTGSSATRGSGTSQNNVDENEQTTETTKGNYGVVSAQDLVLKYRETILNFVQQIINDERISELFMRVY